MSKFCTDRQIGDLLHAYELGMLSDEERDSFESHLLECDVCYEQVNEFAPRGAMLAGSDEIRQDLAAAKSIARTPETFLQRLWQALWPSETPVPLRPAVLTTVLILLLYPSYLGFRSRRPDRVATVQEIALLQTRSQNLFRVDSGLSVVLSFLSPAADSDEPITVILYNKHNSAIYENRAFSMVDRYRVGRLLLPARLLSGGTYRLVVRINSQGEADASTVEYVFEVVIADI